MVDVAPGEHLLELPFDLTAPRTAREWLQGIVNALPEETRADVLLLASEIVTNAVRYGHGPAALTVRLPSNGQTVTLLVHDCGPSLPPKDQTSPSASMDGGRGLLIVSMLSTRWGVEIDATPPGKTVWFQLTLPARLSTVSSR